MKQVLQKLKRGLKRNRVLLRFYALLLYGWIFLYLVLHFPVSQKYIAVYLPIYMAKSVAFVLGAASFDANVGIVINTAVPGAKEMADDLQRGFGDDDGVEVIVNDSAQVAPETPPVSVQVAMPAFRYGIIYQCAGIFGMMIYVSAIIAFPSTLLQKLAGIALGITGLYAINTIRMSALGIIGTYWNDLFHFFHEWMWQGIFIAFVIVFWLIWKEIIVRRAVDSRVSR
jgi:exosortase/archaeosortase family protein